MAFSYYKTFTTDHTQCGTANSSNFPITISVTDTDLKTVGNGGFVQSSSGFDIRPYFDSLATSPMTFELVFYDGAAGTLELHAKTTTLDHVSDTIYYLFFGDASISTDGSSTSTWASHYQFVCHVPNGTSLTLTDSTSNAHAVTNHGLSADVGVIDGGVRNTAATGQYADLTVGLISGTAFSVTCWGNWNSVQGDATPWGQGDSSTSTFYEASGGNRLFYRGVGDVGGGSNPFSPSTWKKVDVTYDGVSAGTVIYQNSSVFLTNGTTGSITAASGKGFAFMGDQAGSGAAQTFFCGFMDEIRVSNITLTPSWITAEFENQHDGSTFLTWGSRTATTVRVVFIRS